MLQYPIVRSLAMVGAVLALGFSTICVAQETTQQPQASTNQVSPQQPATSAGGSSSSSGVYSTSAAPIKLLIGPGDEGDMSVYGMPEMLTHFRVGADGEVNLPLLGNVKIAGMTANDAEAAIAKRYEDNGYLKSPQITILVKDYTTQGISVMGEVNRPGVYSPLAARRLFDLFLTAGGLSQRASRTVTIQHSDDKQPADTITLSADLMATPETNVALKPGDSVIVSRAGVVYVIGEVNRPGEFVISAGSNMTALQVLAMAAGPSRYASLGKVKLMHKTADGFSSSEVDLKKIMESKSKDVALNSDDIMLIPASKGKIAADRGTSSVLGMLSNLALYRF